MGTGMATTVSWMGSTDPDDRSGVAHFSYDTVGGQGYTFDVRLPDFRIMRAIEFWAASMAVDHLVNTRLQLLSLANTLSHEIEYMETELKTPNASFSRGPSGPSAGSDS